MMGKRVLVVGRAGMDLYADPPGTTMEEAEHFWVALGGSSGNIAAGLSCQGVPTAMLTCVSDDPIGHFCLARLEAYGVDTSHVRLVTGGPRTSLAFAETRGDATRSVLYRNNAADFQLSPADVERVDMQRLSAIVATGTALAAEPSRGAVMEAFGRARGAGVETVLDLDYRPYSWSSPAEAAGIYRAASALCDVVIGNDDEFDVFAEAAGQGLSAARGLARTGATVVYKMGAGGARVLSGSEEFSAGIFRVAALKPTGAGDAFMSGFLAARLTGAGLADAVRRGAASAAIVVSRVGCAPASPTAGEIDAFIAEHPGQSPGPED